jgi:glycosyltransferase involved in cell wall biosynthesis
MAESSAILFLRHAAAGGGGADSVVLGVAARLDRDRFRPVLGYLRKHGQDASELAAKARRRSLDFVETPGRRWFDPVQFGRLSRLVRERDVRLVHCNDAKTDVYGWLLGFCHPSLRRVTTLHGWASSTRRGSLYNRLDKWAAARFDAVIAVSEHTARIAEAHRIPRVRVIRNGIDAGEWRRSRPVAQRTGTGLCVGYVGRLSREKRPDCFVEAARRLAQRDRGMRFLVVGDGPERSAMERDAHAAGLDGAIRFLGYLDEPELKAQYEQMDVLMLTSDREGLPISLLEAAAMEVCVVATRVGGVPELVRDGHNGLLAPPNDAAALAEAVASLARDPMLAEGLRRNGRRAVETEFSLQRTVGAVEAVYDEVLSRGRRTP